MTKNEFLNDLRRFLSNIPEEEREQAISYYEDYFEDAGPENEQKVILELGAPIDIAKQIRGVNPDAIEYGKQSTMKSSAYLKPYQTDTTGNEQGTAQNNFYQNMPKKSWTESPGKVALFVVLLILAIPVGIPVASALFGLFIGMFAVIFSILLAIFATGGGLTFGGIMCFAGMFANLTDITGPEILLCSGVGLILIPIGIFLCWLGGIICAKVLPALFKGIGAIFHAIGKLLKNFFC